MERIYKQPVIAVAVAEGYPENAPFHPSVQYPEYRMETGQEENAAYAAVRELLYQLGLDAGHYGSPQWNPLGTVIGKGQTVVIKPNFVRESNTGSGSIWSVITHPAVIRAVVDYVYLALEGEGRIIIADAPTPYADFEKILAVTHLESIRDYYRETQNFNIEIDDLREYRYVYSREERSFKKVYLKGDPEGYTVFDLGPESNLNNLSENSRYYGEGKDREKTVEAHTGGKHEYCICNTILNADVVITIPKMKTHGQVGATLNVKNFIGCVGNKNYLPHFRLGDRRSGGDELRQLQSTVRFSKRVDRLLKKILLSGGKSAGEKVYNFFSRFLIQPEESGYWSGNDTLWRTVSDVFHIMECGNSDGTLSDAPSRKIYGIIDGIIAGDHNGPNANDDRRCGLLIAGNNMIASDLLTIRLMGYDFQKIPLYRALTGTVKDFDRWIHSANVKSDVYADALADTQNRFFNFCEPDGWKGKLKI